MAKKKLLTEIDDEYADIAHEFAHKVDLSDLPHSDIFGTDKWRVIQEFGNIVDEDTFVGKVVRFFRDAGHKVDLNDGMTSYQKEIPQGPKAGEMVDKRSRLGKRLGGLESFYKSFLELHKKTKEKIWKPDNPSQEDILTLSHKIYDQLTSYREVYDLKFPISGLPDSKIMQLFAPTLFYMPDSESNIARRLVSGALEEDELVDVLEKIGEESDKDQSRQASQARNRLQKALQKVQSWEDDWNRQSKEIVNKADEIIHEHYIVYTRHPVDVLRMSDFENIDSCMSETGQAFNTVYAEMRGHGVIAYLISQEEYEKIDDWQQPEIFWDDERKTGMIKPIARTRVRRFRDMERGIELSAPNQLVFGKNVFGFTEQVTDFLREKQEDKLKKYRNAEKLELDNFASFGGKYHDRSVKRSLEEFTEKEAEGQREFQYKTGKLGKFDPKHTKISEYISDELVPALQEESNISIVEEGGDADWSNQESVPSLTVRFKRVGFSDDNLLVRDQSLIQSFQNALKDKKNALRSRKDTYLSYTGNDYVNREMRLKLTDILENSVIINDLLPPFFRLNLDEVIFTIKSYETYLFHGIRGMEFELNKIGERLDEDEVIEYLKEFKKVAKTLGGDKSVISDTLRDVLLKTEMVEHVPDEKISPAMRTDSDNINFDNFDYSHPNDAETTVNCNKEDLEFLQRVGKQSAEEYFSNSLGRSLFLRARKYAKEHIVNLHAYQNKFPNGVAEAGEIEVEVNAIFLEKKNNSIKFFFKFEEDDVTNIKLAREYFLKFLEYLDENYSSFEKLINAGIRQLKKDHQDSEDAFGKNKLQEMIQEVAQENGFL